MSKVQIGELFVPDSFCAGGEIILNSISSVWIMEVSCHLVCIHKSICLLNFQLNAQMYLLSKFPCYADYSSLSIRKQKKNKTESKTVRQKSRKKNGTIFLNKCTNNNHFLFAYTQTKNMHHSSVHSLASLQKSIYIYIFLSSVVSQHLSECSGKTDTANLFCFLFVSPLLFKHYCNELA